MSLQQFDLKGQVSLVMFNKENTNIEVSTVGDFRKEQTDLMKSSGYRSYLKFISNLFDEKTSKNTGNSFTLGAIVGGCGFRGKVYQEIEGKNKGFHPLSCQEIDLCLRCSTNYTIGQAGDTFDLFENIVKRWGVLHGEQLDLWQDVFTLPCELWKVVPDNLFRKAINKFFRRAYGGLPATLINIQTWHSDNPLDGKYLHAHCDSLNLFYDVDKGFYSVNSYIDVDKNRGIWLQCVKELAKDCGYTMDDLKEVNLNHSYVPFDDDMEHRKEIRHNLNYDMRKSVGDIVKWIDEANRLNYGINEGYLKELYRLLSDKNNKKEHVWIGWLADGVKNKYLAKLGLHVKTDSEVKMEQEELERVDRFIHPITGKEMVLVEDRVHLDNVPDDYVILKTSDKVGYKQRYGSKMTYAYIKKPVPIEMEFKRFERVS